MSERILIIEDEEAIRQILSELLISAGYEVTAAGDGLEGIGKFRERSYCLVLLDVMMPKIDGYPLCRLIRNGSDVPIIMLTALDEEEAQLRAFELKVDDYITKPYSMAVLYAKITALINRSRGNVRTADTLTAGVITVVLSTGQVLVEGLPVELSPKEYALLVCLMRNRGLILSRDQLLVKCWGYDYEGDSRSVDTYIRRLRGKLGTAAGQIKTVIKTGYRLEG